MAQIDAFRFLRNVSMLFAPAISDGQEFTAYVDEDNEFSVQADNILKASSGTGGDSNVNSEQVENIAQRISALKAQADELENLCSQIPAIDTAVSVLKGDSSSSASEETTEYEIIALRHEVITSFTALINEMNVLEAAIIEGQGQSGNTDNTGNAGSSIAAVDDIVYGYCIINGEYVISPYNVSQLKGRPYLADYNGEVELIFGDYMKSSQLDPGSSQLDPGHGILVNVEAGNAYAGFADGKIHTVASDGVSYVSINNGDIILNKADNALYAYDANNHKFIKISGERYYVVDYFVDYVGKTLPDNLNSDEAVFLELNSNNFYDSVIHNHGEDIYLSDPDYHCSFANIQSILNDDASIYTFDYALMLRVIHDLCDGDTVYNKADGCLYTFTVNNGVKSFVKISGDSGDSSSFAIAAPVLDFVSLGESRPSYPNIGDKYLEYDIGYGGYLYTAIGESEWDNGVEIQNGARYISADTHKIYEFHLNEYNNITDINISDIPTGGIVFNKADNSLYVYDGTNFIKNGGN